MSDQTSEQPAQERWGIDRENVGTADSPTWRVYLVGPDVRIRFTEGLEAAIPLLNVLEARAEADRQLAGKQEGAIEKLTNIIDGYSWLAEGRGPYSDTDPGYDEDVRRFVHALLDAKEPGRWEPWQTVLNQREAAEGRIAELEAELQAALTRGLTWGRETDEAIARAEAAETERDALRARAALVEPVIKCLQQEVKGYESPMWDNPVLSAIRIYEGGHKYLVTYIAALTTPATSREEGA